ncbi:CYTH domain-containing protein [Ferrimonas marina]|uniref:CYTH domain-containing protein n=1 Tax=Ferrimonas marina TaxID=299255 RepID=A0A1M5ZFK1_9GAMM|nr:CYTH domain-containing protein [Ferrimonas marina]SHI22934.1 CYTH domain-containing protein [Ferrimonas marina]
MEIEIKLLPPVGQALPSLDALAQWLPIGSGQRMTLGNCYFDTPELALRHLDMGLRVRRQGEAREQTIKTASKGVGGLHARGEYNVAITQDWPDLALFPPELWSKATRQALQAALVAQFDTDFERQAVTLEWQGSRVELVRDSGWIRAGDRREAIAELELELVEGEAEVLLALTERLMSALPLRLGLDSKAARGYRLAGLQPQAAPMTQWATPGQQLVAWQRNEACLLAGIEEALAPLRQLWQELGEQAELAWLAQVELTDAAALASLQQHNDYGLCQLRLLRQAL